MNNIWIEGVRFSACIENGRCEPDTIEIENALADASKLAKDFPDEKILLVIQKKIPQGAEPPVYEILGRMELDSEILRSQDWSINWLPPGENKTQKFREI